MFIKETDSLISDAILVVSLLLIPVLYLIAAHFGL